MNDPVQAVIDLMHCPQCSSNQCGPFRCRFSGITHELFRENQYAEKMIRRDKEQPQWLRELRTGVKDTPHGY